MRPRIIGFPIAFYPELAHELGGIEEALYYQQIHYWSTRGKRDDGYIYKSVKELEEETTLTRFQQDRVRKKLIKLGWLKVKKLRANGAPTLHFLPLISVEMVLGRFVRNSQIEMRESGKSEVRGTDKSLTEITHRPTHTAPIGAIPIAFTSKGKTEVHTIMPDYSELNDGDVQYGDDPEYAPRKKAGTKYGRRTMSILVRCYLKAAQIDATCQTCQGTGQLVGEVGTQRKCFSCGGRKEYFDASRFASPLSQLLRHYGGDPDKVMAVIEKAGAFFESKGLAWNIDTVNKDHDLIDKWIAGDKKAPAAKLDVSERRVIH